MVIYCIKLFRTGINRHDCILMSLLLLVRKTITILFDLFFLSKSNNQELLWEICNWHWTLRSLLGIARHIKYYLQFFERFLHFSSIQGAFYLLIPLIGTLNWYLAKSGWWRKSYSQHFKRLQATLITSWLEFK